VATGAHYWTQIADPSDLERLRVLMVLRGFEADPPLSFMRPRYSSTVPGKVVGRVPWSITDVTTFSRERLVYSGAPTAVGDGTGVDPAVVEVLRGSGRPIDTRRIETPDVRSMRAQVGDLGVREQKDAAGRVVGVYFVDRHQLTLDSVVQTQRHGTMTVREFWESDLPRVRCQTLFRDSTSWNGYLGRHNDEAGTPFHYDNGLGAKYVIPRGKVQRLQIARIFPGAYD
jgi:hypothetical protein